jgi:hypothetical protein
MPPQIWLVPAVRPKMWIGLSPTGTTRDRRSALNMNIHISRSPLVAATDLPARGLDALVRASVHHCNDETELERFVHVVAGSAPRCDPAVTMVLLSPSAKQQSVCSVYRPFGHRFSEFPCDDLPFLYFSTLEDSGQATADHQLPVQQLQAARPDRRCRQTALKFKSARRRY